MEREFWAERWSTGQIGFHMSKPHPMLVTHVGELDGRRRVLVPLCGKAFDLRYLAERGHEVVGIEFMREAVEAFFLEQEIVASPVTIGPYEGLTGGGITLLVGDFFLATKEALGPFDALYDRAALVALDPSMREAYAARCLALCEPDARLLLITFVYDQTRMDGPPFSVDEDVVHTLYGAEACKRLEERRETPSPRFVEAGVEDIVERIHLIRRR